jgi:N-acetylneuraminic acid mutarotase
MRVFPVLVFATSSCGGSSDPNGIDAVAPGWTSVAALPEPVANNAVAALSGDSGCTLLTATGIDGSRAAAGIHARAWKLDPGASTWTPLPDAPGPARIAASAVSLRGRVYVLGGYSVAANGDETTHDTVAVWDPAAGWTTAAPLPVPIDDAVVVAWRERWIVVVSGWSNTRPVSDVQIYDADTDRWEMGNPFAGTPVFGHAGALVDDKLLVVDGVGAGGPLGGFAIKAQTWLGVLDPAQPAQIAWSAAGAHPGPPRYRAAAGVWNGRIVIHGGTDTPYNFDGLRYDTNAPAVPLGDAIVFDPSAGAFVESAPVKPVPTMDHRGLVTCGEAAYTIGGMEAGPMTTTAVSALR